jgi:hypothetical protein
MLELWKYNEATHQKVKLKKTLKYRGKILSLMEGKNVVLSGQK